jgi:ribose transport system ATP-binding protein
VQALRGVNLDVARGSVHALIGHNGSGKSTLVKTLAGVHEPDPGAEACIDDVRFELGSAEAAAREGIRFVHQELGIVSELSALDNVGLVLGFERGRYGTINWRRQARATADLLRRFGIELDLQAPLGDAPPVARTAVAIVRAVAGWRPGRGLLVLDEPTAALPAHEVDELFRLVREIRDSGTAVLFISHRLDEVMSIADHATVLRDGQVLWSGSTEETTIQGFATLIAGEARTVTPEVAPSSPTRSAKPPVLDVSALTAQYLNGIDLTVSEGEIVGVAGLLGSGREELPYIVAGAQPDFVTGNVSIGGTRMDAPTIEQARLHGVALVPADRANEGIIADFKVRENTSLAALPGLRTGPTLSPIRERSFVKKWLRSVNADPGVTERPITTLSGGNQQKVVLARWLCTQPRLLVMSEPTAGVDVGGRDALYKQLRQRADDGLAILVCSSDVEDLIAVCSRVVVLRDGLIVAEYTQPHVNKATIIAAMEGVHSAHP